MTEETRLRKTRQGVTDPNRMHEWEVEHDTVILDHNEVEHETPPLVITPEAFVLSLIEDSKDYRRVIAAHNELARRNNTLRGQLRFANNDKAAAETAYEETMTLAKERRREIAGLKQQLRAATAQADDLPPPLPMPGEEDFDAEKLPQARSALADARIGPTDEDEHVPPDQKEQSPLFASLLASRIRAENVSSRNPGEPCPNCSTILVQRPASHEPWCKRCGWPDTAEANAPGETQQQQQQPAPPPLVINAPGEKPMSPQQCADAQRLAQDILATEDARRSAIAPPDEPALSQEERDALEDLGGAELPPRLRERTLDEKASATLQYCEQVELALKGLASRLARMGGGPVDAAVHNQLTGAVRELRNHRNDYRAMLQPRRSDDLYRIGVSLCSPADHHCKVCKLRDQCAEPQQKSAEPFSDAEIWAARQNLWMEERERTRAKVRELEGWKAQAQREAGHVVRLSEDCIQLRRQLGLAQGENELMLDRLAEQANAGMAGPGWDGTTPAADKIEAQPGFTEVHNGPDAFADEDVREEFSADDIQLAFRVFTRMAGLPENTTEMMVGPVLRNHTGPGRPRNYSSGPLRPDTAGMHIVDHDFSQAEVRLMDEMSQPVKAPEPNLRWLDKVHGYDAEPASTFGVQLRAEMEQGSGEWVRRSNVAEAYAATQPPPAPARTSAYILRDVTGNTTVIHGFQFVPFRDDGSSIGTPLNATNAEQTRALAKVRAAHDELCNRYAGRGEVPPINTQLQQAVLEAAEWRKKHDAQRARATEYKTLLEAADGAARLPHDLEVAQRELVLMQSSLNDMTSDRDSYQQLRDEEQGRHEHTKQRLEGALDDLHAATDRIREAEDDMPVLLQEAEQRNVVMQDQVEAAEAATIQAELERDGWEARTIALGDELAEAVRVIAPVQSERDELRGKLVVLNAFLDDAQRIYHAGDWPDLLEVLNKALRPLGIFPVDMDAARAPSLAGKMLLLHRALAPLVQHGLLDPAGVKQWWSNGDCPGDDENLGPDGEQWEGAVVRYFRRGGEDYGDNVHCPVCDHRYHDHGWIDSGGDGQQVCPGDLVFYRAGDPYKAVRVSIHELMGGARDTFAEAEPGDRECSCDGACTPKCHCPCHTTPIPAPEAEPEDRECEECGTVNDAHHSAACVDKREAAAAAAKDDSPDAPTAPEETDEGDETP